MSDGQAVWWTVQPENGILNPQMRDAFLALMKERGLQMAQDERIPQPGNRVVLQTNAFRLCIWEHENEAQEFADELVRRTRTVWQTAATQPDD